MDRQDVVATLSKLQRMDADAVGVYEDAIGKAGDAQVKQQLQSFQEDHRRHTGELEALIRDEGWQVQEPTPEFERLMEGFTRQVGAAGGGSDQLMVAMDVGERVTNAEYAEALRMDIDDRCTDVLRRAMEDERRHLDYIEQYVPDRWGEAGVSPLGSLDTATTGDRGKPYEEAPGGAGAYGGGGGQAGDADMSTTRSHPAGGLNAGVRKHQTSKGSEMAGGGTGAEEGHPNLAGQVEGDSGSSGSGVAGSGSGD